MWLSGRILTALNKVVFPILWILITVGLPAWVFARRGRVEVDPGFYGIIVAFALVSVFVYWFTWKVHWVGYSGRELVVADLSKQGRIPFEEIERITAPWYFKGQTVVIRFRRPTVFGQTIYYVPKWAPVRVFSRLDRELRDVIWAGRD